jgi:hypothetical protein
MTNEYLVLLETAVKKTVFHKDYTTIINQFKLSNRSFHEFKLIWNNLKLSLWHLLVTQEFRIEFIDAVIDLFWFYITEDTVAVLYSVYIWYMTQPRNLPATSTIRITLENMLKLNDYVTHTTDNTIKHIFNAIHPHLVIVAFPAIDWSLPTTDTTIDTTTTQLVFDNELTTLMNEYTATKRVVDLDTLVNPNDINNADKLLGNLHSKKKKTS